MLYFIKRYALKLSHHTQKTDFKNVAHTKSFIYHVDMYEYIYQISKILLFIQTILLAVIEK